MHNLSCKFLKGTEKIKDIEKCSTLDFHVTRKGDC